MSTYTEAGRGRKQCPACQIYIGVRSNTCVCGHLFNPDAATKVEKTDEPKEIKTFTEAGPGRKQCPACQVYVGVRSNLCICGHAFTKKEKEAKADPAPTEVKEKVKLLSTRKGADEVKTKSSQILRGRTELIIPAGKCPVHLIGVSEDALNDWVKALRDQEKIYYLGPTAIMYWLNDFYARESEMYRLAKQILTRIFFAEIEELKSLYKKPETTETEIEENEFETENE